MPERLNASFIADSPLSSSASQPLPAARARYPARAVKLNVPRCLQQLDASLIGGPVIANTPGDRAHARRHCRRRIHVERTSLRPLSPARTEPGAYPPSPAFEPFDARVCAAIGVGRLVEVVGVNDRVLVPWPNDEQVVSIRAGTRRPRKRPRAFEFAIGESPLRQDCAGRRRSYRGSAQRGGGSLLLGDRTGPVRRNQCYCQENAFHRNLPCFTCVASPKKGHAMVDAAEARGLRPCEPRLKCLTVTLIPTNGFVLVAPRTPLLFQVSAVIRLGAHFCALRAREPERKRIFFCVFLRILATSHSRALALSKLAEMLGAHVLRRVSVKSPAEVPQKADCQDLI